MAIQKSISTLVLAALVLIGAGCNYTKRVKTGKEAFEVKQYAVAAEMLASQTIMRLSGGTLDGRTAMWWLAVLECSIGVGFLLNIGLRFVSVLFFLRPGVGLHVPPPRRQPLLCHVSMGCWNRSKG